MAVIRDCDFCFGDGCLHCGGTGDAPLTQREVGDILARARRTLVGIPADQPIQPPRLVGGTDVT